MNTLKVCEGFTNTFLNNVRENERVYFLNLSNFKDMKCEAQTN